MVDETEIGQTMIAVLADHSTELAALCRQNRVRKLDVFGSAARADDFGAASDIDLLVEYEPGHRPTLAEFLTFKESLSALFGREVDLTMESAVRNPYVRADIERYRRPLHAA